MPGSQTTALPNLPTITETVSRFVITQAEETERLERLAPLAASNPPVYVQQRQATQSPIAFITTYFMLIYPFGVLILALYYTIHYAIFVGLYRRRNLPAGPGAMAMLANMCSGRPPRLYYNQLAETPMLFGIFRPAIILPYQEYTRDEMQAILSHELTHLRRKDVLVKWLTLGATALHWFNPIIWLVSREVDRACELSCDEAIVNGLDRHGKAHYGNTLILVAANPKTPRAITSATMSEDKKNLKERLGAIMKSKKNPRYAIILSTLLILAAIGLAACLGSGGESPAITPDEDTYEYNQPSEQNEPEQDNPETEATPTPTELTIQMAPADNTLLSSFDSYHELDFRDVYMAHWDVDLDWLTFQSNAAIWANVPLSDFQLIGLYLGHSDGGVTASATHTYYQVEMLETPLVINWFFTAGLFPNNGISFIDPSGVRRFFAIRAAYGYEGSAPFTLIEFEDGGYLFSWDPEETETQEDPEPQEEPDPPAEPTLIWIVPPTREHDHITRCNCGFFIDQEWRVVDPITGQLTGDFHGGHGGPAPDWVYDPALGLFGHAGYEHGYHSFMGMHTPGDFEAIADNWDIQHSSGLIAVQAVDSTRRQYLGDDTEAYGDLYYGQDWWRLTEDAFTGMYAVMYNRRLITDFVFTDGAKWWHRFMHFENIEWEFSNIDLIPMNFGGNNWGAIDRQGNVALPFIFENLVAIDENRALARVNGMYGILDMRATMAAN